VILACGSHTENSLPLHSQFFAEEVGPFTQTASAVVITKAGRLNRIFGFA